MSEFAYKNGEGLFDPLIYCWLLHSFHLLLQEGHVIYIMCYMITKSRDKNQVADLVLDIAEEACDAATTMFAILQCTETGSIAITKQIIRSCGKNSIQ